MSARTWANVSLVYMHQLHMFLQISFLAEGLSALLAFESFNTAVEPNMVFNVARLVKRLPTAVY
jgi:hypothetical protein